MVKFTFGLKLYMSLQLKYKQQLFNNCQIFKKILQNKRKICAEFSFFKNFKNTFCYFKTRFIHLQVNLSGK
jgi:hypothetical protein